MFFVRRMNTDEVSEIASDRSVVASETPLFILEGSLLQARGLCWLLVSCLEIQVLERGPLLHAAASRMLSREAALLNTQQHASPYQILLLDPLRKPTVYKRREQKPVPPDKNLVVVFFKFHLGPPIKRLELGYLFFCSLF